MVLWLIFSYHIFSYTVTISCCLNDYKKQFGISTHEGWQLALFGFVGKHSLEDVPVSLSIVVLYDFVGKYHLEVLSCYEIIMVYRVNSLSPNNPYGVCSSWSILVQVMACCLMAPSHYLNQSWLIISEIHLHQVEGSCTENVPDITHYRVLKNYTFENIATSPWGQWDYGFWKIYYEYGINPLFTALWWMVCCHMWVSAV